MSTEEHNDPAQERRPAGDVLLVKILAILFVLGIYTVIFLKILVLA